VKLVAHLRALVLPLAVLVGVLGASFGLFVGIWGFARLKLDAWPLDSSRVGPNICASIFLVILLVAHNEFVVVEKARKQHESTRQELADTMRELLHPTEDAEASIAAQVESDWRAKVLGQLDETSPGGLGTILGRLPEK
jgi:hypothetical protein